MRLLGWLLTWVLLAAAPVQAANVSVKMLARDSALIAVNGKQHMLRAGEVSPEGVKLLSATHASAEVSYKGKRYHLTLANHIATHFDAAQLSEVRIASRSNGHFFTPGRINGRQVDFIVDTGATAVAMNADKARQLGVDYRAGSPMTISTANGTAPAYRVQLNSVSVGGITVRHVEAYVTTGRSPRVILLGNSFLRLVDMNTEHGVLVLRARQ